MCHSLANQFGYVKPGVDQKRKFLWNQDVTSKPPDPLAPSGLREEENNRRGAATQDLTDAVASSARSGGEPAASAEQSIESGTGILSSAVDDATSTANLIALQQAATTLTSIASRAEQLPGGIMTLRVIDQAEQALTQMRQTLTDRRMRQSQ